MTSKMRVRRCREIAFKIDECGTRKVAAAVRISAWRTPEAPPHVTEVQTATFGKEIRELVDADQGRMCSRHRSRASAEQILSNIRSSSAAVVAKLRRKHESQVAPHM